jgi:hypothetical protein
MEVRLIVIVSFGTSAVFLLALEDASQHFLGKLGAE